VQSGFTGASQASGTALAGSDARPSAHPERLVEMARQTAESALIAKQVDELVDAWLKEAKQRARIRWREAALQ
jgi:hypothetical protein